MQAFGFKWISIEQEGTAQGIHSLCLGKFDGVHLGHQHLIQQALAAGPTAVLTFFPHPLFALGAANPPERLFDLDDQREQFQKLGVHFHFIQRFDQKFASLSAEQFLQLLKSRLNFKHLFVGKDFQFGHKRSGNLDVLNIFCSANGIKLSAVDSYHMDGELVSTSRLRQTLSMGDIRKANLLLARPYNIRGTVLPGEQRGRQLGFPTANLLATLKFRPLPGVYAGEILYQGLRRAAVANIGSRPTVSSASDQSFEVHILDFNQDIYGEMLKFEFKARLREERKFASLVDLRAQITKDVEAARALTESSTGY